MANISKINVNGTTYDISDTKVTVTTTNPTTATTYYPVWYTAASGTGGVNANDGLKYYTKEGTTSAAGTADITIGNNKNSTTAGNKKGGVTMYGSNTGYTYLTTANTSTTSYTITLPAKTGTVALTGTSLSAYGITDAYTKTEVDTKLSDIETALDALIGS